MGHFQKILIGDYIMGFFDSLMKAGAAAINAGQSLSEEVEQYKEKYKYASDQQLFQNLKYGSYASRSASSILLQERNYSQQEIAAAMKR